jgi:hypothetical protein
MLTVKTDGETGGECRVDNVVKPEVLGELQKLPWPKTSKPYLFKQTYLLK